MTGAASATGRSMRFVRTALEVAVLAVGWVLGGTVGIGTVLYALLVGAVTQSFLPHFTYRRAAEPTPGPGGPGPVPPGRPLRRTSEYAGRTVAAVCAGRSQEAGQGPR